MARRGENIYKRRDGRWEARYIKSRTLDGKAVYGYIYRRTYLEVKRAQTEAKANCIAGKMEKLKNGRLDGKAGLSVKTSRDIIGLLKRSLKPAGIVLQVKLPHYSLPKPRVLTATEQSALITTAKNSDNLEGLGVLLSLFTGIRIGELCSLKWQDVSLKDGVLKIDKTIQRRENFEGGKSKTVIDIGTPKSESSIRNIPLPQFLLRKLKELKETAQDDDYILSGNHHYVEPRRCQYRFKKLVRKAGIQDINFHVLRHTFATRCVELGIDIKTISEILGHSSVNMTLNRYVHPTFEHQRECMEKLSPST